MNPTFTQAPLALIVTSLTNPRKTFDPVKLAELTESIKAMGVHQPVLLRPLPASRVEETASHKPRPEFELVAGERRYRASKAAGLQTIPAMVRELTDNQVLEIQIVENLQRDDLTELEEAEGYEALMQHSELKAEEVGAKIGKSRSYVYGRLKLLDLSFECKQAMREGKIDASRALLIARIPDGKLQAKALEEATEKDWQGEVPSVRAFQTWLQKNVMLRLDGAPFKITDARLVEAAGSCKECPKRTGANPDLFSDVAGADICTDPTCYRAKEEAHRDVLISKAEAKGMTVITGKEAKEICPPHQYGKLSGYTPLSQVRADCAVEAGRPPTLRELLGKDAPSPVLIEHPTTKELIEAVPTEQAEAMLLAKGLIKALQKTEDLQDDIEHLQKSIEAKTKLAKHQAKYHAVADAIRATTDKQATSIITADVLRAWFDELIRAYGDQDKVAEHFDMELADDEEDPGTAVAMHVRASSNAALHRALAKYMLHEDMYGYNAPPRDAPIVNALAASLGVDTTALEKAAANEVKAETAAELKRLKAELKQSTEPKPPAANAPAAQAKGGGGKSQKSNAPLRVPAPRMSVEEAQLGIAAAMQGIEVGHAPLPDGAASADTGASEEAADAAPHATGLDDAWARSVAPSKADAAPHATGLDHAARELRLKALALITREQKATVRMLKTELGIGTAKALQVMDWLEAEGAVSPTNEGGTREVLVAA